MSRVHDILRTQRTTKIMPAVEVIAVLDGAAGQENSMPTHKRIQHFGFSLVAVVLVGVVASSGASAAIYYVDANAASDSGNGSQSQPKKFIQSGLALLSTSGGDVLEIAPGTYSNAKDAISSVPRGTASAYNVVRAAVDGSVVIKNTLSLNNSDHFVQFEGLKWDHQSIKVLEGRFLKFLRCAFKGGPSSGNTVTVQIGSNNSTPGAQSILLEDSWVYGSGGRYKILVYNSDKVILRRVLARHDGGWTFDGSNPQAGITIYDSTNVQVQNPIVIDGLANLTSFEANIFLVANNTTSQRAGNVHVRGGIVLGGGGNGIAWDGDSAYSSSFLEDVVVWGPTAGGIAANGAPHRGTITRATVKSGGTGFADWEGGGGISVSSSIAYQNPGGACASVSASAMVSFGNGSNNCGTVLNPLQNGLLYLPRIEAGSTLSHSGAGGGQAGAQIVKRIGQSGTLHGDPGYDQVTTTDLWPWPQESRIKADLAEVNSRGFSASNQSLTDYIWSFLGNPSPISSAAVPNPPTALRAD